MEEQLLLHPEAALFWPRASLLVISDLHLGKTDHFRKNGIALPGNLILHELERIDALIGQFEPREVLFLGDLFHSFYNASWEKVVEFTGARTDIEFSLVEGNHDIMEDDHYSRALIGSKGIVDLRPPFLFAHDRIDDLPEGTYGVFGHIHPGVRLGGQGMQRVTLPAFIFGKDHLLMPAFGAFTGLAKIYPNESDNVFAIAEGKILHLSR